MRWLIGWLTPPSNQYDQQLSYFNFCVVNLVGWMVGRFLFKQFPKIHLFWKIGASLGV